MGVLDTIIRRAIASGEISATADEPDADASTTHANEPKGTDMAHENASGAAPSTGISEADHKAAVAKAEAEGRAAGKTEGKAEGLKEANERTAVILGAEGIKGDGKRMAAALDLAMASPAMPAEAVVGFVTGNVAAATKPQATNTYESRRLAAAQLASPNAGKPAGEGRKNLNPSAIYAGRRNALKGA